MMKSLKEPQGSTSCLTGLTNSTQLLEIPECDLIDLRKISYCTLKNKLKTAAKEAKPPSIIKGIDLPTVSKKWNNVSTGCPQVDRILRGGILTRGITELSGQSGAGKTQLCLQLALNVQLTLSSGGLDSGAVYICTEDRFPSKRLNQIIESGSFSQKCPHIKFGNNIFVEHIADAEELQQCVNERLPQIMRQHSIGLIVVDSVAAVFRADYTSIESLQRARDMRVFAYRLHSLANTHNVAIVCVNQVSDVKRGEQSFTVPALGLAWANLVTSRLQMFRQNNNRLLRIIFAPHIPPQSCQFTITSAGVVGLGS